MEPRYRGQHWDLKKLSTISGCPLQTGLRILTLISILEIPNTCFSSFHKRQSSDLFLFFYLGFLSRIFTSHMTAVEGGGHSINSSLPVPPALQTLRHKPGDYCRELTFAYSWHPDSNLEPLVSERKSLTTKLRALRLQKWLQKQLRKTCKELKENMEQFLKRFVM